MVAMLYLTTRPSKNLPPGPRGWPLVGNIRDLPPPGVLDWEHWWKYRRYGPLASITVLGQTIILVNETQAAFDLMDKRSAIHSSRPQSKFLEMSGWDKTLACLPYSSRFRAYRKNLREVIGSKQLYTNVMKLLEQETGRFLVRMSQDPDVAEHARTQSSAVVLYIGYGYTIEAQNDPLVALGDQAMNDFGLVIMPGKWLVDQIPALRYLPSWLPGMSFKETAKQFKQHLDDFANIPMHFVESQIQNGKAKPSYISSLLQRPLDEEGRLVAQFSAASLYAGGLDTTVSSIEFFFLAMTIYPDIQAKAQQELDRIIGNRLPELSDLSKLPYVSALVKECFRWHPVAPLAVPHMASQDDEYNGYHIPKGSILVPNVWGFLHDPDYHHDAFTFEPERFLGPNPERDPTTIAFGFGRRLCPGKDFAINSVHLMIARSLSVFSIERSIENGRMAIPEMKIKPGIISHLYPYKNVIKPRSKMAEHLIQELEIKYAWSNGDSEELKTFMS